jgi:hypothetical protein
MALSVAKEWLVDPVALVVTGATAASVKGTDTGAAVAAVVHRGGPVPPFFWDTWSSFLSHDDGFGYNYMYSFFAQPFG